MTHKGRCREATERSRGHALHSSALRAARRSSPSKKGGLSNLATSEGFAEDAHIRTREVGRRSHRSGTGYSVYLQTEIAREKGRDNEMRTTSLLITLMSKHKWRVLFAALASVATTTALFAASVSAQETITSQDTQKAP